MVLRSLVFFVVFILLHFSFAVLNVCEIGNVQLLTRWSKNLTDRCGEEAVEYDLRYYPYVRVQDEGRKGAFYWRGRYAMVMYDADGQKNTGFVHWMLANLTGTELMNRRGIQPGDGLLDGKQLEYYNIYPKKNTGKHNFFIYIFEISKSHRVHIPEQRNRFNFEEWMKRSKLNDDRITGAWCIKIGYDEDENPIPNDKCKPVH